MRTAIKPFVISGVMILFAAGTAHAGSTDVSGEYWYGWLGADAATGYPDSDDGQATFGDNTLTVDYIDSEGFHEVETIDITDTSFDSEGWFNVTGDWGDGSASTRKLAVNGNVIIAGSRQPDDNNLLGISPLVGKADEPAASDIVGEYACLDHWLDVSSRGASVGFGTVSFVSDGSWSATFPGESETGTWTLNSSDATVNITSEGTSQLGVGANGLMTFFDNDPDEDDDLGHSILLKKGTGRTASEALGEYLIQGFYTDEDGTDPLTEWGKVILQENNCWSLAGQDSDGNSYAKAGSWTLADDGFLQLTDLATSSLLYEGYLSLDGELIVATRMDNRIGTALMVQVPEPTSLALLTLGGLAVLRKRRSR